MLFDTYLYYFTFDFYLYALYVFNSYQAKIFTSLASGFNGLDL